MTIDHTAKLLKSTINQSIVSLTSMKLIGPHALTISRDRSVLLRATNSDAFAIVPSNVIRDTTIDAPLLFSNYSWFIDN